MHRIAAVSFALLAWFLPAILAQTEQAKRGQELFVKATKGVACAACHALGGQGTAVGPDLKNIARVPPKGIVTAVLASVTQYVQEVKLKTGETFPAMKGKEEGDVVQLWDLSKTPPEEKKVPKAEIDSMKENSKWKHEPEAAEYSDQELADLIAYIKWAAYKNTSTVKPEDLQ